MLSSSSQLKRPNQFDLELSTKSIRVLNWSLLVTLLAKGQVVARQPPSGDIGSRIEFQQLLRSRRQAGRGNHVVREWLAGQRVANHCTGHDLREVARARGDRRQTVHALGWLCSRKPSR